ncbi:MAG: hypothetical protein RSA01_03895 [Clostridium sp.]
MTSSVFNLALLGALGFFLCFVIYGYLRFRKKGKRARKVRGVFLITGILILLGYIALIVVSFFAPAIIKDYTGEVKAESSHGITSYKGLEGSIFNGQSRRESTGNLKVDAILEKGDALLIQNNMQKAIDEYEIGLREKGYEKVFRDRIEYAKDMRVQYKYYIKGVDLFNTGQYGLAYSTLKMIKPNELEFYIDAQMKIATITYLGEAINSDILSRIKPDMTKTP